ncbi:hypothetical protein [Novipirellula rosea]|uniref:Uncharacterized protein n=1 Tax=Novipirellula rosea TaxID=1031540 RepID=A0ABP8MCW5_9BACT
MNFGTPPEDVQQYDGGTVCEKDPSEFDEQKALTALSGLKIKNHFGGSHKLSGKQTELRVDVLLVDGNLHTCNQSSIRIFECIWEPQAI